MKGSQIRLDRIAPIVRNVVDPRTLGDRVAHYSIPAFDAVGGPIEDRTDDIESDKLLLRGGEVLISKLNPRKSRVVMVAPQRLPIVGSTEFIALNPVGVDPRWLCYWLRSDRVQQELMSRVQSVTRSQQRVEPNDLCRMWLDLPSPGHQRAIADFLDAETSVADRLIANRTAAARLHSEHFMSAVFAEIAGSAAPGERADSGLEWLGPTPTSWQIRKVAWDYEVQLGKMLNQDATQGPEPKPYLRNANVQWDHVALEDVAEMSFDADDRIRFALRPGDLLVCEGGEVGRAALWDGQLTECYYQKALHRVRPRRGGNPRFLMYCLWAASSSGVFNSEGNQSTIVHLTAEKLQEHRFPCPPPDEQATTVRTLDLQKQRLDSATALISRQVALLLERRQALITAAVTGQIPISGAA